jgi:iron complex transport system permease protein
MSCGKDIDLPSQRNKIVLIVLFALIMLSVALVATCIGSYNIGIGDVFKTVWTHLFSTKESSLIDTVIWQIRLPRIITALIVGAGLSFSGAIFQATFKNPLAEPYILGVSSGAAFGAGLAILFPAIFFGAGISAFVFALIAVSISYFLSRIKGETQTITLILGGIVTASLFAALLSILKYVSNSTELREIVFWLMGGFYYSSWNGMLSLLTITLVCFIVAVFLSWKLNILSLGDDEAKTLGVNVNFYRPILILLASLAAAIGVSKAGTIAWVGLMIPHVCRMFFGSDNRLLIPASAIIGGTYLVICDTLARSLVSTEIPIGIITSIIAAPYVLYLIRKKGKELFK